MLGYFNQALTMGHTNSPQPGCVSRKVKERSGEHWAAYRGSAKAKAGSHIYKHQELHHGGEQARFMMRAISFHSSALSRQTAEAVRIRRRGGEGAVLNSRSEYSRCYIPRLQLVEEDKSKELEMMEEESAKELGEELRDRDSTWERKKSARRAKATGTNMDSRGIKTQGRPKEEDMLS